MRETWSEARAARPPATSATKVSSIRNCTSSLFLDVPTDSRIPISWTRPRTQNTSTNTRIATLARLTPASIRLSNPSTVAIPESTPEKVLALSSTWRLSQGSDSPFARAIAAPSSSALDTRYWASVSPCPAASSPLEAKSV